MLPTHNTEPGTWVTLKPAFSATPVSQKNSEFGQQAATDRAHRHLTYCNVVGFKD